ncbi:hypothetical protein PSCICM_49390 [Pseudomonas cichorii]|uniref:Uncharacterized protein n=1 Tax=Pseudomonas cichorii TaxID=36746 RepID=A0ABQ1DVT8_PSECI|nr:hypothetical protein PSCICM_49390 [Pseudomonas cichorii]GFM94947.1 hypothetical protein PSCICP_49190 [Pseudomonas cichorii]
MSNLRDGRVKTECATLSARGGYKLNGQMAKRPGIPCLSIVMPQENDGALRYVVPFKTPT